MADHELDEDEVHVREAWEHRFPHDAVTHRASTELEPVLCPTLVQLVVRREGEDRRSPLR